MHQALNHLRRVTLCFVAKSRFRLHTLGHMKASSECAAFGGSAKERTAPLSHEYDPADMTLAYEETTTSSSRAMICIMSAYMPQLRAKDHRDFNYALLGAAQLDLRARLLPPRSI